MGILSPQQGEICRAIYTGRGSAETPSHSFESRPNTGMFLQGDEQIAFSVAGIEVLVLGADGLLFDDGTAAAPSIAFDADTDTGFYRIAANRVALTLAGVTAGDVVGTSVTQTLTNKTFDLTSNTFVTTSAQLATAVTNETGSGLLVFATSPTLTTPVIGAATGTSVVLTGAISSSSPSAGIGYATGAGAAVTQGAGRTTGVTINAISGAITTDTASLAAEADATFVVTNSSVAIGDVVVVSERSGSNGGMTTVEVGAVAAGSFSIDVVNNNAAAGTAETGAIIINFAVIKAVSA